MRATFAIILLACIGICYSRSASAQHHHRRAPSDPIHAPHAGHVYFMPYPAHGGYAVPTGKSSYSYGWFGVKPRRHQGVHYGYYNNRKQWSYR